ncbi:MAG: tetratricopeptide repeat protein [Planctomycetes bacterium]|nr:tetratricopeptide repeat protein [Planctomycetota bacterium]
MSSILVLFLALLLPAPDEADDQYQFIAGLCEKGMYDMAVKEAEAFLKEHRGHAREAHARYRLATALFELERGAEAAPHFRRLLDLADFEFAAEAAFRLGECELRAGRFAEAEAALARVLELDRPYLRLPATFLLGEAAFRKGDFAAARPLYEQALATDAEGRYAREARYGIAWCRFRCGEYDAALAAIEEFTRLHRGDPLDGELRFLAGECLLEAGRPQEALAAYTQVEDGPFLDSALRGAGFALGELDEHAAAAEMFGKVVERVPESRYAAEATLQCGIHLLKAGQAEAAAAVLSSATAQEGAELCYWRSRARAAAGDPAGALADCERALALKPEAELCERCQVARGDLLFDLGRSAEAAEAYAASESDHALYSAAAASLNAGRPAGARQLAERLLAERKESSYAAAARAILGECLLAEEDYAGAAAQFLEAARSGDEAVKLSATERAGWCRFLNGEHAAAAEAFRWVVDHGQGAKEQEEALYMLGRACEGTGQQGAALRSFERHLAEHPEGAHRPDVLIALLRLGRGRARRDGRGAP